MILAGPISLTGLICYLKQGLGPRANVLSDKKYDIILIILFKSLDCLCYLNLAFDITSRSPVL